MIVETIGSFTVVAAKSGKVFKSLITGDVLTDKLYLGCNDLSENYEEIEMPIEEVIENVSEEQEPTSIQTQI